MPDTDKPITRQAIEAKNRSGKLTVSGKLKTAIDLMLFDGSRRADAAKAAGMSDHGLREAFKKPHVKGYYNTGLEVLRTSERARNIHRLIAIRDKAENMPAVQAIKELELTPEQARNGEHGGPRSGWLIDLGETPPAGLVVQISVPVAPKPRPMVDVTPEPDDDDPTVFRPPRRW